MAYEQLLNQLFSVNSQKGMKLGLDQMHTLSKRLGSPEKKFPSIHIAGSNGKGSVATKIAKGLKAVYPKVGLFTSPHISSFRERIKINDEMISVSDMERLLSKVINLSGTFFELTTLVAFLYFAEQKVDYAVIETGLGGRLDATNIIHPKLSVITSISLEHCDILGDSIEEIAKEKAGIIKTGIPVVLGPKASIISSTNAIQIDGVFSTVEEENRAIAKLCMEMLNLPLNVINSSLDAKPPCRMEKIGHAILDVAHNPDALSRYFKEDQRKPLHVVCALSKNKDLKNCLRIISHHAQTIHLVSAPNGRSAPPSVLKNILIELAFQEQLIKDYNTIPEAVKSSLEKGNTAVIGSFFIMSQARQSLGINEPVDQIEMNESL